jgi:hypothetical protein
VRIPGAGTCAGPVDLAGQRDDLAGPAPSRHATRGE